MLSRFVKDGFLFDNVEDVIPDLGELTSEDGGSQDGMKDDDGLRGGKSPPGTEDVSGNDISVSIPMFSTLLCSNCFTCKENENYLDFQALI